MNDEAAFKLGRVYEILNNLKEIDFFEDRRRTKDLLDIIPTLNEDDMDATLRTLLYGREHVLNSICNILCMISPVEDDY